jgi:alpha-D-ribose 1-methylphosphonate 5-triphosphate diphosphatase PhnM
MKHFSHDMKITVNKFELIQTLSKNKAKHIIKHEQAMENWRLECESKINEQLNELKKTGSIKILSILQHPPENMSGNYQDTIDMLTWHTEDAVILDQEQFAAFIQDKWEWSTHWAMSNSKYLG